MFSYNSTKDEFEFDFYKLVKLSFYLPLFSFIFGVLLSMTKDFEEANRTHCKVTNIFPSISASIGSLQPQSAVWRTCIGLDSFPRYFISYVHYKKLTWLLKRTIIKPQRARQCVTFIKIMFTFNAIELTSLMILSFVPSSESTLGHQGSFVLFLASSYVYMAMWVVLGYWQIKMRKMKIIKR